MRPNELKEMPENGNHEAHPRPAGDPPGLRNPQTRQQPSGSCRMAAVFLSGRFSSRPADIRNTAAGWPAAAALPEIRVGHGDEFSARWRTVRWRSWATLYSAFTRSVKKARGTETMAPGSRVGTIRERVPTWWWPVWARMARPPLGMVGPPGKVRGPSAHRVLVGADGLGAHLAGEVNLQRGVHRNHIVVPARSHRVIGVPAATDRQAGMLVHKIIEEMVPGDKKQKNPP